MVIPGSVTLSSHFSAEDLRKIFTLQPPEDSDTLQILKEQASMVDEPLKPILEGDGCCEGVIAYHSHEDIFERLKVYEGK
ncbi:MAG: hypothetical protein KVP17_000262 [Porospora cf. gigantea B]|nr:MAG: hypothetical protein KVP17_000262 [Porospora cf. gigantea B]